MSKTLQIWSLKQIFLQFTYIKPEPEVFNVSVDTLLTIHDAQDMKNKEGKKMKEFLSMSMFSVILRGSQTMNWNKDKF